MTNTQVHPPKPRPESLRQELSSLSWTQGASNFFINDIPFSFSTGKRLASLIRNLIDYLPTQDKTTPLQVIELGAGLGILSKRIIDQLETKWGSLEGKISFDITDSSKELIDQINTMPTFNQNQNINQNIINAYPLNSAEWTSKTPINLALAINLCDSMPNHHIEVDQGVIYVLYIETELIHDEVFIDTTTVPPRCLDADEVRALLLGDDDAKKRDLMSRLISRLKETWHRVPLAESSLSQESQALITEFVKSHDEKGSFMFNFSEEVYAMMHSYFTSAAATSAMMVCDFGHTDLSQATCYDDIITDYGSALFSSVCFPYLRFLAKKNGFSYWCSDFTKGESQVCLLYRGLPEKETEKHVLELFSHDAIMEPSDSFDRIQAAIQADDLDGAEKHYAALSPEVKDSYAISILLAGFYFVKGQPDKAEAIAKRLIETYGDMALSAYKLLGHAYRERCDFDAISRCVEQLSGNIDYYADMQQLAAMAYGHLGRKDEFYHHASRCLALATSDETVPWTHLITMLLFYLESDEKKTAKLIADWICETGKRCPSILPEKVKEQAKEIRNTYL